jgi:hypothetical protein
MNRIPQAGDDLERKRIVLVNKKDFHDRWDPCRVIRVDDHSVCVEYPDGTKEAVQRGQGMLRFPR